MNRFFYETFVRSSFGCGSDPDPGFFYYYIIIPITKAIRVIMHGVRERSNRNRKTNKQKPISIEYVSRDERKLSNNSVVKKMDTLEVRILVQC